jgi:hypothetical protein
MEKIFLSTGHFTPPRHSGSPLSFPLSLVIPASPRHSRFPLSFPLSLVIPASPSSFPLPPRHSRFSLVIPAKAGIFYRGKKIPAFAGMT